MSGGISRRAVLVGGAATTAAVLVGCGSGDPGDQGAARPEASSETRAQSSSPSTSATTTARPAACELSPELTAGPYYLEDAAVRSDITEGRPGAPMTFAVQVLAHPGCEPLEGAVVDVWQCDAGGEYSGFNGNSLSETQAQGTNDKRFLRGVQRTDAAGIATFTTIFPGWYEGRTVHIHLKVIAEPETATSSSGPHIEHVGQAFFDETTTVEILQEQPYAAHVGTRTTNAADSIFQQAGPNAVTELSVSDESDPGRGWTGRFTCVVDPSATPPSAPPF